MKATQILKDEHRVIERVLTSLERIAREGLEDGRLPRKAAVDALKFFREFADGCHHKKEENQLFPLLEARGLPRHAGPTSVMRAEHELGRELILAMAQSVEPAAAGDPRAVQRFAQCAQKYAQLLRQHIQKEDHCLFEMAESLLGPADQDRLEAAFEKVERTEVKPCCHEHCLAIADQLEEQFGPSPKGRCETTIGSPCCGGH